MKLSILIPFLSVSLVHCQTSDDDVRNSTCEANIGACSTICANNNSTDVVNKCDPQTYNFQCTCKNHFTPPQSMNTFPAAYQACFEKKSNCKDKCGGDSSCSTSCDSTFNCISKDANDGKTATVTSASATKSGSPTGAPNLNGSNMTPIFSATTLAILLFSLGSL